MVELKLLRQLNYYEKLDAEATVALTESSSEVNNTENNDKEINRSQPSKVTTATTITENNDKHIWRVITKAVSALNNDNINNSDDNRSIGDSSSSSVNRQMRKNVLKMLIKNLQQEGNNDDERNNYDGNGSVSTKTTITINKPPRSSRKSRQNSNCSDISTDDWDGFSESSDMMSMRPKKQNSIKHFFTSCLTTLQDEGEKVE